jgi:hypothetical protein
MPLLSIAPARGKVSQWTEYPFHEDDSTKLMQLQQKMTQNLNKFTLQKMQVDVPRKNEAIVNNLEVRWLLRISV